MGINIEAGRDVHTGDIVEGTNIKVEDVEDSSLDLSKIAGHDLLTRMERELGYKDYVNAVDAYDDIITQNMEDPDVPLVEQALTTLRDLAPYAVEALTAALPWLARIAG